MRSSAAALLTTCALLVAAACSDSSIDVASSESLTTVGSGSTEAPGTTDTAPTTDDPTTSAAPIEYDFAIEWQGELEPGIEQGYLEVPRDYADPSAGSFRLYVVRHLADPEQRIGSLLVNPGGPGFGGSILAVVADNVYGDDLLAAFDIIGWDPRGTGLSEPAIDCIDDYDHFYAGTDITPDDAAERQHLVDLAQEYADSCVSRSGDVLPYVGTNNSARDMDAIRQALGEDTISYFGFSYGSELGATWATMFPDTVRAAVLDGAADPDATLDEGGIQQSEGFEESINTFLARCSDDAECPFHSGGDAEGAFDDLMLALDDAPVPTEPGRPDLTRGMALTGVAYAMYDDASWPDLEWALQEASRGDGSKLLALYDGYMQRQPDGTYDNSLEAFQVISCMDDAARPTVEEDDAAVAAYREVAPRFAPNTAGSYFCTFFPDSIDPRVAITGIGAGPILVMGTTGDPATPLSSTEAMADALEDGRLVVVTADQHTGYGVNPCSVRVVDEFLIDPAGAAPDDGTRCD